MNEPKTHTVAVPGAVLRYDIREPDGESAEPLVGGQSGWRGEPKAFAATPRGVLAEP